MSTTTRRPSASNVPARPDVPTWSCILSDAVEQPGIISSAYGAFWHYSVGNQLLAYMQCTMRKLEIGPINTFAGWLKVGRPVRKGEKAITLCMPVKSKMKPTAEDEPSEDQPVRSAGVRLRFVYRPHWFVLGQTDGEPFVAPPITAWDERTACHNLVIDREPFHHIDGNVQGHAHDRSFAVSPIAFMPHRTMFHEIAHIVLNHTAELIGLRDGHERTPTHLREVEAEATALICCKSLGLPGEEFSRGYIQHWLGKQSIDDRTAQRIFHAADAILRAGRGDSCHRSADPSRKSD